MLTVHHLRISQSERIVWLCEELGLEYALKLYMRRGDNNLAPDEYKALHPMGIAPVITDGELTLGESGAICEYIDRKYGGSKLSPGPDQPDFAAFLLRAGARNIGGRCCHSVHFPRDRLRWMRMIDDSAMAMTRKETMVVTVPSA